MQQKETANEPEFTDLSSIPSTGRLLALDLGTKRIGIAITDESRTVTRPLDRIARTSWKKLLIDVDRLISDFDAKALVIGLPYGFNGEKTPMYDEARTIGRKFALSLEIPVFFQDERVTSYEAKRRLWERGADLKETSAQVDSEAAAIILSDFLDRLNSRLS